MLRYVRSTMYTAAIQRTRHGCACLVARQPLSRLPPGPPEPDQGTGRARNVKQSFAGARVLLAQEIHIATETSEMSPSSTKRESESLLT